MKNGFIIALVLCSLILVASLTMGFVLANRNSGSNPKPPPLSPQDQCSANGYIWDASTQTCTSTACSSTVDANGKISGTVVNISGNQCVDVQSGAYLSPFARAALLQLCQNNQFANVEYTNTGPQCTKAAGCNTQPYRSNSIMDGCPYLTLQPEAGTNNCVAPTSSELEQLCNTTINGCPLNSSLNSNCPTTTPCFNATSGCVNQNVTPGCRPEDQMWQWINDQCVNTTVSNTLAVTVSSATVTTISGTFVLPQATAPGTKLLWNYVLTSNSSASGTSGTSGASGSTKTWQGPVVTNNTNFTVSLTDSFTAGTQYNFILQVYVSVNDSPYILKYTSVAPAVVTLTAAPVAPGLTTIKPVLDRDMALNVAENVPGALMAANQNSSGTSPFVVPSSDVWSNSLPAFSGTGNATPYLIVPCTSAYCKTALGVGTVMLILAWPVVTQLSTAQSAEIQQACPQVGAPQISYAVYSNGQIVGDRLTEGSWVQPLPSDPSKTWTFQVVAYVWSSTTGGDRGIENSQCKSQPLEFVVQVPNNLYSVSLCYNIQPLKPQGAFIPGNFMLYHPGDNMCSAPVNSVEALGARDFSCLTAGNSTSGNNNSAPSLSNMALYACSDLGFDSGNNCNSSGQGCGQIAPVTTIRQPGVGQSQCSGPPASGTIPCSGAQYCQEAACYCPETVEWDKCGTTSYAIVGSNNTAAIEAERWKSRVQNVSNFIQYYGLDTMEDVQTFLNESASTDNLSQAWSNTYASGCPLPKWDAPQPGNCDVTQPNACQQSSVCGPWVTSNGSYQWKQEIVQYPSASSLQGNQACCPANSTWTNGCCCPVTDTGTSCADLKGCTSFSGALSNTWCAI